MSTQSPFPRRSSARKFSIDRFPQSKHPTYSGGVTYVGSLQPFYECVPGLWGDRYTEAPTLSASHFTMAKLLANVPPPGTQSLHNLVVEFIRWVPYFYGVIPWGAYDSHVFMWPVDQGRWILAGARETYNSNAVPPPYTVELGTFAECHSMMEHDYKATISAQTIGEIVQLEHV